MATFFCGTSKNPWHQSLVWFAQGCWHLPSAGHCAGDCQQLWHHLSLRNSPQKPPQLPPQAGRKQLGDAKVTSLPTCASLLGLQLVHCTPGRQQELLWPPGQLCLALLIPLGAPLPPAPPWSIPSSASPSGPCSRGQHWLLYANSTRAGADPTAPCPLPSTRSPSPSQPLPGPTGGAFGSHPAQGSTRSSCSPRGLCCLL